jgi:hypothetical protein
MPRPITAVAVRRLEEGSPCEVQSAGGLWFPITQLGDAAKRNLWDRIAQCGYSFPIPKGSFYWQLSDINQPAPQPQPVPQPMPQPVNPDLVMPDDDDDQPVTQPVTQPQPNQPNPDPDKDADMTIEDIVRKIAGDLDTDAATNLTTMLTEYVDNRLQDFQPVNGPDTPLRDVIANITINRPDAPPIDMKGIFHNAMPDLMFNIINGIHTYLPGPPGSGKTHSAIQCIRELGGEYAAISFGPTTPESRLTGGMTANGEFFEPALLKLIRSSMEKPDTIHSMILDEMDNGHGGIQATLNSLLANGEMTAPNGDHLVVGKNLVFIACANTYGTGPTAEFSGRNKLDAATLDRFDYLPWDTDESVETALVHAVIGDSTLANAWLDVWRTARRNAKDHGLKVFVTMRGAVRAAESIAAGRPIEKALMMTLGNKVPADQWAKMNPL